MSEPGAGRVPPRRIDDEITQKPKDKANIFHLPGSAGSQVAVGG